MAQMEEIVRTGLQQAGDPKLATVDGIRTLTLWGLRSTLVTLAPILGVALVAGLVSNVAQVRLNFSMHALKPSLSKLNPGPGFKRLVSPNSAVEALKAVAKTAVVGLAAYIALKPKLPALGELVGLSPDAIMPTIAAPLVMSIATRVLRRLLHHRGDRLLLAEAHLRQEDEDVEAGREDRSTSRPRSRPRSAGPCGAARWRPRASA